MIKKNDIYTIKIEDIGTSGEGIGKVDGYALFVKDAVTGDVAEVKVTKAGKNFGYARLMRVVEPSPYRVEPICPEAKRCGGCQIQAISYAEQLKFKENKVYNNLVRIGGLSDFTMHPIIGMDEPFHYRNKAQFPVGTDKNGNIIAGFYAGRTHSIIETDECVLGVDENREIVDIVKNFMREYGIKPYDEIGGSGLVRHILIRKGFVTGQIMVCIIINGVKLPHAEELVRRLRQIEGMTSISLNVNRQRGNVILGSEIINLYGDGYIEDYIKDIKFQISPLSFYQVNPVQTEKLYDKALEYAGLTGKETVWDLYCGIGTISLFMARSAARVFGVEVVPQAIDDANRNAEINGISNAQFVCGKAEDIMVGEMMGDERYGNADVHKNIVRDELYKNAESIELYKNAREKEECKKEEDEKAYIKQEKIRVGKESAEVYIKQGSSSIYVPHPDVIVVDPPRKGCDRVLLDTIIKNAPKRIVYVSCDPATLARDLKILCENGYEVKDVQPIDVFPQTVHVETVVQLVRKTPDAYIDVTVDMDELDLTASEAKATYREIKDYILEKHGVKVSSLYIAQIKQKYGIIERDNFNTPRSENVKQPHCPPEKEKLIEEALRHYKMIQ